MMAPVPGDKLDPEVEASYFKVNHKHTPAAKAPERVERFAFYERAKKAFTVVMTG
jgi:L-fucose mutarotase